MGSKNKEAWPTQCTHHRHGTPDLRPTQASQEQPSSAKTGTSPAGEACLILRHHLAPGTQLPANARDAGGAENLS